MDHGFPALAARLDYPLFVVTAAADGENSGCLVGFATQCSIHPARFIVCVSNKNHTHRVAAKAGVLAVHVLARRQEDVARLFGTQTGDETDKFRGLAWKEGPEGVPLLVDCPNRFVGRVIERVEAGDHTAFLLEVVGASVEPEPIEPLTFQQVRHFDPGHEA